MGCFDFDLVHERKNRRMTFFKSVNDTKVHPSTAFVVLIRPAAASFEWFHKPNRNNGSP